MLIEGNGEGRRTVVAGESTAAFSPRIVDALVDALVLVDDLGQILYANPAVERLLGWEISSLFARPFVTLFAEPRRGAWTDRLSDLMSADHPPRSQAPVREMMVRADGSECSVEVGAFLVVPDEGSRLTVVALWDVSDRIDASRYQRVADELLVFLASASGTADEIVPRLLAILATSLEFDFATAWTWDPEAELLRCEHSWSRNATGCAAMEAVSIGMTVRAGEGLAGVVLSSDEPFWSSQLTSSPHLKRHQAIVDDGIQTAFIFPIRTRERLVGVIELFSKAKRDPGKPLLEAVAEVGAKLGGFIERLDLEAQRNELLARLERSEVHQKFLLRANRALAAAHDFTEAVHRLADIAVPTLGEICLIDVLGADGVLERLAARHADPAQQLRTDELGTRAPDIDGDHPAALAVRTGTSQWATDMSDRFLRTTTHGDEHFEITRDLGFRSYLSVPLATEGSVIGALTMVVTRTGRRLGSNELSLAEALADQVATVIQRARDLDEQAAIARHLQASLLPSSVAQTPGLSVSARYVTGQRGAEVGGDFYDVVTLDDDHVALVIGDVEGHDMAAATIMGQLRSALRAYLLLSHHPGEVLGLLDRFLAGQPSERLATASLAVFDTARGHVDLASAGHAGPHMADGRGATHYCGVRPGLPLGVGQGSYPVQHLSFVDYAWLVFYTDGLIDVGRDGAEELRSRLADTVAANVGETCDVVADDLLGRLAVGDQQTDDIALLVVRWAAAAHL